MWPQHRNGCRGQRRVAERGCFFNATETQVITMPEQVCGLLVPFPRFQPDADTCRNSGSSGPKTTQWKGCCRSMTSIARPTTMLVAKTTRVRHYSHPKPICLDDGGDNNSPSVGANYSRNLSNADRCSHRGWVRDYCRRLEYVSSYATSGQYTSASGSGMWRPSAGGNVSSRSSKSHQCQSADQYCGGLCE